eukprot:6212293-Pleurochrysis_carterae.AAC.3
MIDESKERHVARAGAEPRICAARRALSLLSSWQSNRIGPHTPQRFAPPPLEVQMKQTVLLIKDVAGITRSSSLAAEKSSCPSYGWILGTHACCLHKVLSKLNAPPNSPPGQSRQPSPQNA